MGVRVRVRIRRDSNEVSTSALINTGYESTRPEIHIPIALLRRLGFSLENLRSERYAVVGAEVSAYIAGEVYVRLDIEKTSEWIKAVAVAVPGEYEVIISDMLAEELGLEIIAPRRGLWRVRGETNIRTSSESEYWVE
ncbi:MAG: hypothetical protein ABWJ42_07265 [Sulfolobales archaeon]